MLAARPAAAVTQVLPTELLHVRGRVLSCGHPCLAKALVAVEQLLTLLSIETVESVVHPQKCVTTKSVPNGRRRHSAILPFLLDSSHVALPTIPGGLKDCLCGQVWHELVHWHCHNLYLRIRLDVHLR